MILAVGGVLVQETKLMKKIPHIVKQIKSTSLNKPSRNFIFWPQPLFIWHLHSELKQQPVKGVPVQERAGSFWWWIWDWQLHSGLCHWGSVTDPSDQLFTLPVKRINPTRHRERDRQSSFLSFDFVVNKGLCHMAYDLKWAKIERAEKASRRRSLQSPKIHSHTYIHFGSGYFQLFLQFLFLPSYLSVKNAETEYKLGFDFFYNCAFQRR